MGGFPSSTFGFVYYYRLRSFIELPQKKGLLSLKKFIELTPRKLMSLYNNPRTKFMIRMLNVPYINCTVVCTLYEVCLVG